MLRERALQEDVMPTHRLEITSQNIQVLEQGLVLLADLEPALYPPSPGPGGQEFGVGPHLRHCLDFYGCFLRDIESGRIDYDARERQPGLERELTTAQATLRTIVDGLTQVQERDGCRGIEVRVDVGPGEPAEAAWAGSTVRRELRFLLSHTLHHFALIALVLRSRGVDPGNEFGVAPSTLAFWKANPACAP